MDRTPVESSNIASIGYDEETSTLEVEFHWGGVYQYFDCPLHEYEAFMQCESKGTHFNRSIKPTYRYAKM